MSISKYVFSLLLAITFVPVGASGNEPQKEVVMGDSCVSAAQALVSDGANSGKLEHSSLLHAEDDYKLMHGQWLYAGNFLYRHTRIRGPEWFMTGFVVYFGGARFTDTQMAIARDAGTSYNWLQRIDEGAAGPGLSIDEVLRFKPVSEEPVEFYTSEYYKGWEFV